MNAMTTMASNDSFVLSEAKKLLDTTTAGMCCEFQYKCFTNLEFSIESAERMENCPWKNMISNRKLGDCYATGGALSETVAEGEGSCVVGQIPLAMYPKGGFCDMEHSCAKTNLGAIFYPHQL